MSIEKTYRLEKIREGHVKECPACHKEYPIDTELITCSLCDEIWPMSYYVLEKRYIIQWKQTKEREQ